MADELLPPDPDGTPGLGVSPLPRDPLSLDGALHLFRHVVGVPDVYLLFNECYAKFGGTRLNWERDYPWPDEPAVAGLDAGGLEQFLRSRLGAGAFRDGRDPHPREVLGQRGDTLSGLLHPDG